MRPDPTIPLDINNLDHIKKGLYRDTTSNHFFYLSNKGKKWYVQYSWNIAPVFLDLIEGLIYAEKIEPKKAIAELNQEKRFIESKLKEITKIR